MEEYATGNFSYPELASELNRRGFRFRDRYGAKRFSDVSIRSVLENAWFYAGRLPIGRERDHGYDKMLKAEHEPIITPDMAREVIKARKKRSYGRTGRGSARVYLLSGILYCHECGDKLWGSQRKDRGLVYYRHAGRTCSPGHGSFNALDIDAQILELLKGLVIPPELQKMIKARVKQKLEEKVDDEDVIKALARERARLNRLREMRLEGEFEREEYRQRKAEITTLIEDLEAELGSPEYDPDAALREIKNLADLIESGEPTQQRNALASIFERIEVSVEDHQLARIVPRRWFHLFFGDLEAVYGVRAWRGLSTQTVHRLRSLIA